MRIIFPLLTASLLLASCIPLENLKMNDGKTSSSAVSSAASFSTSSATPIELPVEIEESSSSSVVTGSGALAERVAERGTLEIGEEVAPLLLTVFTNYGCDYCEEFMRDMLPRLQSDFLTSGKLRVRFVIVPLKKYPNSALEASALLCATALDKGQSMHEALRSATLRDRKSILAIAKKIELPTKQFTTCLDAKETKNVLEQQKTFIAEQNVTLIPSFMLGDEKKVGLLTYADLRGWITSK